MNAASLALMAVVTVRLVHAAVFDGLTLGLAVASAACLLGSRVHSSWLVLGGATIGFAAAP